MSTHISCNHKDKNQAAATFLQALLPPAGLLLSSLNQDRAVVNYVEGTGTVLAPPD